MHEPRTELDEVAALNQFTADRQRRLVGQAFAGTAVLGSATRFVNALGRLPHARLPSESRARGAVGCASRTG